ncbi:hypothetical protein ABW21_db0201272 [Orbilia brochopaga]|nr:hypothetical protein ABW21_db0201272 [Drechslerella brochopaga]
MHSILRTLLSASILTILPGDAKPVPQRIIGIGNAEQICALSAQNPSSTWTNSGASFFLDKFISDTGPLNWVNRLDQTTTNGGSMPDSTLDCVDLSAQNCLAPDVPCLQFTPPQLRFIRDAITNCHRLLVAFQAELQAAIIPEILGAGALISDFGEPEPGFNVFGVINGALSIASGLTAVSPIVSGGLSAVSGIFGILASGPDQTSNIRNDIDARLSQAFTTSRTQVAELAETIFGGRSDTSILARIAPPASNGEMTDIGKFFSGGRFLILGSTNLDTPVRNFVQRGITRIRQALVIRALKSQGYFVSIDPEITNSDGCTPTGSRFMNGKCYKIVRTTSGLQVIEDIPRDTALKLDNAYYSLNLEEFYNNAEACQNANPGSEGQAQFLGLPTDGTLPQCFFNMRVVVGSPFFLPITSD